MTRRFARPALALLVPLGALLAHTILTAQAGATVVFSAPYLAFQPDVGQGVVADITEDGIPDLLASTFYLPGNGDGTFQEAVPIPSLGTGIAVADLDGDGHLDLLGANTGGSSVYVLMGLGGGSYGPRQEIGTAASPAQVAPGDLNHDGAVDLLVATPSGVAVHLGHGDGTFEPFAIYGFPTPRIVVADFNNDSNLDVVADTTDAYLQPCGRAGVWSILGNGDGTFAPAQIASPNCKGLARMAVDVDGDGFLDLVVRRRYEDYCYQAHPSAAATPTDPCVLFGNGDGTFEKDPYPPSDDESPRIPALGDVDGDGRAELVSSIALYKTGAEVHVTHWTPGRSVDGEASYAGGFDPVVIDVTDVNLDSYADIVLSNAVLLNNGDGTFGKYYTLDYHAYTSRIAVGDVTNDGILDLLTANEDPRGVQVFVGLGNGSFGDHFYDSDSDDYTFLAAAFDVNRDGLQDLLVFANGLSILHGAPGHTLGPETHFDGTDTVAVGDQDGDGFDDYVAVKPEGCFVQATVLYGAHIGLEKARLIEGIGTCSATPDLNGDGQPDSLALLAGNLFAWLRGSAGTLEPAGGYGYRGIGANMFVVGDFNGDGRPDVAMVGPETGDAIDNKVVTILLNLLPQAPTPTLVSLVAATVRGGAVRLAWHAPSLTPTAYRLYRRTGGEDWALLAELTPDGTGGLVYDDESVRAGVRYGYRLGLWDGRQETHAGETWVNVPAFVLSLSGALPNPTTMGKLRVTFTLPTAEPATLELFDLAGRRLASKALEVPVPGPHSEDFGSQAKLSSGVYWIRLSQAGRSISRKAVLLP